MSTDALTKQVFENTGTQGQHIWHSIRELQKSKSIVKVNIFEKRNTFRPMTAYHQKLSSFKSKTLNNMSTENTLSLLNFKNEPFGTESENDLGEKEIAIKTENMIFEFEKAHNIGERKKKPNMYPKQELVNQDAIMKKYLPIC